VARFLASTPMILYFVFVCFTLPHCVFKYSLFTDQNVNIFAVIKKLHEISCLLAENNGILSTESLILRRTYRPWNLVTFFHLSQNNNTYIFFC
jgi:hypothetical protein